jgi:hypothetical protein
VSRDTSVSSRRELWLEWGRLRHAAAEARLSRLAAWVLAADRADADYGLRLPGEDIAPGDGAAQRSRAWKRWRCGAVRHERRPGAEPARGRWHPAFLPQWPGWSRLPRETRDTLFLLGVIAWTVLPHLSHLPPGRSR